MLTDWEEGKGHPVKHKRELLLLFPLMSFITENTLPESGTSWSDIILCWLYFWNFNGIQRCAHLYSLGSRGGIHLPDTLFTCWSFTDLNGTCWIPVSLILPLVHVFVLVEVLLCFIVSHLEWRQRQDRSVFK